MAKNRTTSVFEAQFARALAAGQKRDYKKSIAILEDLAAQGLADGEEGHPEIYLYLARSWHAEQMYARALSCARSFIRLRPGDGSGWFFLGRSYLADGRYDRAVPAFKRSVELNPESLDARALLGMSYLKGRKPSLARAVFETALTIAPDDPRLNQGYLNALFVEAVRTYKKGDAETARQMLTFLINNDIDGVVPRVYLAHALRDLGYFPESLGQYEAAIQFAPDDDALKWYPISVLLEMGETGEAANRMASLGETPPEGAVSDQVVNLLIVKNHLEEGKWSSAAQAARAYIRQYGDDAQSHALMGEALRNLGNREQALAHFRRALDLDRQNPAPWFGVFMVLAENRDWAALEAELAKAERAGCDADSVQYYRVIALANLDADPAEIISAIQDQVRIHGDDPDLIVALARTYFRLGLPDLATGWYQKAIELESGNEEAWLGYIACCESLDEAKELDAAYVGYLDAWGDNVAIRQEFIRWLASREKWERAADQIELVTDFGSSDQLVRQLALYRRKAGQFRMAAILYRDMLRKKNDDRVLLANLVYCLDRMGESASALRLMHEANRTFKTDADSLLIEGRLYARTGDFNAALEVFRKVIDSFPKDPRGWDEASAIYVRQGVPEMAAMLAQKARDLGVGVKT